MEDKARPRQETEVFRIAAVDADAFGPEDMSLPVDNGPIAMPGRMRDAGICDAVEIDRLWKQKSRLDEVFDEGDSELYWRAREELYPVGPLRSAGRSFGNRAGGKLAEILDAVGGLGDALRPSPEESIFVDVCGAPGAWSKYLYHLGGKCRARMRGFGFSLRGGTNPLSCTWYQDLTSRGDFAAVWGADGTGDVCPAENIAQVAEIVGPRAAIVLADGAYGVGSNWGGAHLENYQEIIAGRMVLAEVLIMLETLRDGGFFACKLFDTFSHLTAGVLFVAAVLFDEAFVVKPSHSRVVNSERYLVCRRFRGRSTSCFQQLRSAVRAAHAAWPPPGDKGPWSGSAPVSVIAPRLLAVHEAFYASVRSMATALCCKQALALEAVVDRALVLRAKRRRCGEVEVAAAAEGRASAHGRAVAGAAAHAAHQEAAS